jgi:HK97 family phage major capsid protein
VATLIQEEYSPEIIKASVNGSTALSVFPTIPLGTKTTHMPVVATLPEADWLTSEDPSEAGSTKPTSQMSWADQTMVVEEIAVILPIHEDVVADATGDILSDMATRAGEAIGKALDLAVLFGTKKPASWVSPALLPAAVGASPAQTVQVVDGTANQDDLWGAINQASEMLALGGMNPSILIAPLSLRYRLANLRDGDGRPAFSDNSLSGYTTVFNRNGAWDRSATSALIVDPSMGRIGIRQDVTAKFLDQATVGGINLAEKDMVAIRFKARYAYVLGSPLGRVPVAAILPAATGA